MDLHIIDVQGMRKLRSVHDIVLILNITNFISVLSQTNEIDLVYMEAKSVIV